MESAVVHIVVTVVALPLVMFFFQQMIQRADAIREKEEEHWRKVVVQNFDRIEMALKDSCNRNRAEHEQLYLMANKNMSDIKAIQTVQKQHGCDSPRRRIDDH